jgi:hypothetical protein
MAGPALSEEDTRSLAERAEAATRNKPKPTTNGRTAVLTNEDLKKAKGNVIILSATPTPAPPPGSAVEGGAASAPLEFSFGAVVEQRERAARLRGSIEEAQRQLAEATPEQRVAIEQRLTNALDELARAHEVIGALSERVRQGANTTVTPSN